MVKDKDYWRKRYLANREHYLEVSANWHAKNKQKRKAYFRARRAAMSEEQKEDEKLAAKKRRLKNKTRHSEYDYHRRYGGDEYLIEIAKLTHDLKKEIANGKKK